MGRVLCAAAQRNLLILLVLTSESFGNARLRVVQSAYLDDARDRHARACSKTTLQWGRTSMMKIKMWQEPSLLQLVLRLD